MMCHRKGWKYVGVWERSPEKKRLHFHGLFYIPDGAMPGELVEVKDYSPIKKKVQTTIQNTYFNERFGRSDFKTVDDRSMLGEAIAYLTKYMEKTGEKMVYSKGLPQFFISDIMDEDIVCTIGNEEKSCSFTTISRAGMRAAIWDKSAKASSTKCGNATELRMVKYGLKTENV